MTDEFGGIPVDDAGTDEFGGIPVAASPHAAASPRSADVAPPEDKGGLGANFRAGFTEGLSSLPGTILNAVNPIPGIKRTAKFLTTGKTPTGQEIMDEGEAGNTVTHYLNKGLGLIGLNPEDVTAQMPAERVARFAGTGATAILAPGAAPEALAEGVAPRLVSTMRNAPIATTARKAITGAAAGTGAGIGNEVVPDDSPVLKGAVSVLGAIAGGAAAEAPAIARGAARGVKKFAEPMTEAGQRQTAADTLRARSANPGELQSTLDTPPPEIVPGSQPTTFQQTGDMGLGELEREQATKNPAAFMQRRTDQNQARMNALTGIQAGGNPDAVGTFLRGQFRNFDDQTQQHIDALTAHAQTRAEALGGHGVAEEHGAAIRSALQDAENAAKARERSLWKAVDPDNNIRIDASPTFNAAADIKSGMSRFAAPMEGSEAGIFESLKGSKQLSLGELADLRSRVSTAARNELISSGNSPAYARLIRLRGAIQNNLADAATNQATREAEAVAAGQMPAADTIQSKIQSWVDDYYGKREQAGATGGEGPIPSAGGRPTGAGVPDGAGLPPSGGSGNAPGAERVPDLPQKPLTKEQMIARGADGHLARGYERYIPVDQVDGLEPTPAAAEGKPYFKGQPITQPIEVAYDKGQGKYMLYAGNHRMTQANINGDKYIRAFVEPDGRDIGEGAVRSIPKNPDRLPSSESLNTPRNPTPEEMAAHSSVRSVPLDSARGTQRYMDWDKFNAGEHPGPLLDDYADKPVAVRREDGEHLILDGHHRTAKAISEGEKAMDMHVIDAKNYDPENMGRKPSTAPPGMSDDYLLRELGVSGDEVAPNGPRPINETDATNLAAATQATKERAAAFNNGPTKQVLAKAGSQDAYRLPEAKVPEKFFHAGPTSASDIQGLRDKIGDAAALPILQDYAAASLRKAAENADGTIDPRKMEAWQRRFEGPMRAFPELGQRFENAAAATRSIGEAAAARREAIADRNASALGKVMNANTGEDVTKTVGSILAGKNAAEGMAQLAQAASKSAEAAQGLRQAVADHIAGKLVSNTEAGTSGTNLIKADQFHTFLKNNRTALAKVFTPEEMDTLDRISADLKRANRSNTAVKLPAGSNTAQDTHGVRANSPNDTVLDRMLSEAGAAAAGTAVGHAPGGFLGFMGAKVANAFRAAGLKKVDDLITEAMLNPELARDLLRKAPPKPDSGQSIALAARMRRIAMSAAATRLGSKDRESHKRGGRTRLASGGESEGSDLTPAQIFDRNKSWLRSGAKNFTTALKPDQETAFRGWVKDRGVNFDPDQQTPDYDMRGFYSALQKGDPRAVSAINPNDQKTHYPDYWKTPYDVTFSNESQWANKFAPKWTDNDQLVTHDGTVVWDDKLGGTPAPIIPTPRPDDSQPLP